MQEDKKTIGVMIRFFTDGLSGRVGQKKDRIPFWTCGNVHIEANKTKGIKSQDELFYYFDDIPRAIKEVMKRAKLVSVEDIGYSIRAQRRERKR